MTLQSLDQHPISISSAARQIVFVFDNLPDWQSLASAAPQGAEVIVLDGKSHGLQQIADHMDGRSDVAALHLLSHGAVGMVELGSTWLNSRNIGEYSELLDVIGAAMAAGGDILLYAFHAAQGTQATVLLSGLARLTRADLAASVDPRGAADKGGDWQLERQTGEVETTALSLLDVRNLLVVPSDKSFDSGPQSALNNGGETIAGMSLALFAASPDSAPPGVSSVTSSTANGVYKVGDVISIQVNFSEPVIVAGGMPQLTLETGTTDRAIDYASGSGTSALSFNYTVKAGDLSADLDYRNSSALALGGATIRDLAGNDAALMLAAPGTSGSLGANKAIVVDGVAPVVVWGSVPANGTYGTGTSLDYVLHFSEVLMVEDTLDIPYLEITIGGQIRHAAYVHGSGSNSLIFRYIVQNGDNDGDGIVLSNDVRFTGSSMHDIAGNTLNPGFGAGLTPDIQVDGLAPVVNSISRVGSASTNASSLEYTVTFSEAVTGTDVGDFKLTTTGSATGTVASISGSGSTYTVTVDSVSGSGTLRLDLQNAGIGIVDAAGNAIAAGFTSGQTYAIDTDAPAAPSIVLAAGSDTGASSTDRITSDTTPTFTGSTEPGATVWLYGTDGTTVLDTATADATTGHWSLTSSVLPAGTHTFTVKAMDMLGNISAPSSALVVIIDTAVPDAPSSLAMTAMSDSGSSNSDGITRVTTPTIKGLAEAGSVVTLYDTDGTTVLGMTVANGSGNWSITSSSLSEGVHTLTTRAKDVAGNTSAASKELVVTIDTYIDTPCAPDLAAASDSGVSSMDDITNVSTPTFTGIAEANSSVTLYDTDGVTVLGMALAADSGFWSITSSVLAEGAHNVSVRVMDVAGNVSAASPGLMVNIDTTAPAAPSTPHLDAGSDTGVSSSDKLTASTTPVFSGMADAFAHVSLYDSDGTTVLGSSVADGMGNWSITSSALSQGSHMLTARATDMAGNASAASAELRVTVDSEAPVFASAAVNGSTLVLTYSESDSLDAVNHPAPGAFTVMVGLVRNVVTAVVVNAAENTVTLTLATPVPHGNAVTVAYSDSVFGKDANALRDAAGNDAATLVTTAVTNTTPPPKPGTPTTPTTPNDPVPVDGVPVTTTPGDGGTTIISIPVVTPSRPDTPGTPSPLADIPLVKGTDGHAILQVSVPTGVGLQAQGLAQPLTGAAALAELGLRIERSAGGDAGLTNNGQVFLATLDPSVPLTIQTITATAGAGFNPDVPLVISGSAIAGDGMQAVIFDARALPSGTTIQVDNVDFLAVVGAVRIIGGAGQNMASGDGAAQYIVLGAEDDIIHGGGGNDTVGSKGGNDQVFGDAGDDIVFGGAGNDLLSGGSGSDRLNGGTGFDIALQEGKRSDYTITLDGAGVKLTHDASGVSDWLVDVEQVRFATGPSLTVAHSEAEEAAAFLFQQWMGRDPTPSEGAVIQTLAGQTALQVADLFAQVYPQQAGGRTAQQLLDGMDSAGAIRVDAARASTFTGDAGDNSFTPTPGLAWSVDGGAGVDTVVFPASFAQLHIEASDAGFTLQRMTDGAMLELSNVERLTLEDTQLALDLDGHAGQAAKLVGAVAGAAFLDNKPLVGEVLRALDTGVSAQSLAQLGLQLLGAQTAGQVTQLLWTNVVGSAATPEQLQPFVSMMAQGMTGGELAVLASNLELNATRIDLVGLAAIGIEFA
jgi:uncharacterized repeat protein (TIGR02059 family)